MFDGPPAVTQEEAKETEGTGLMPNYRASGADHLRSKPTTKHAAPPDPPSASGEAAKGTANLRGDQKTLREGNANQPGGSYDKKVEGVQSFTAGRRV